MKSRWLKIPLYSALGLAALAAVPLGASVALVYPRLPSLDALKDYRPQVPLRVFTADGALIGSFGYERRAPVRIDQVPPLMKDAILAAEDDRFYEHHGIDFTGLLRAVVADLHAGGAREGASTITMQVARNFFLSREKTVTRKLSEMMLTWKIEENLSKDQILELYINQIYLGQRAYGFQSAAQTYFGKPLDKLSVAEMAVLAGLPKAPSAYNPVVNPERSSARQHYVLKRMNELGFITDAQYQQALAQPITVRSSATLKMDVDAPYAAEMVRQAMYDRYGDSIYTSGMKVYTTLTRRDQQAADQALSHGLEAYDRRHGWRGPEDRIDLPTDDAARDVMDAKLAATPTIGALQPAIVLDARPSHVSAYTLGGQIVSIKGDGLRLVAGALGAGAPERLRLRRGAVVRVRAANGADWQIGQVPEVEGALVSVDPKDGGVLALAGGYSFDRSKFNHVTQAWRQPGSSFKPFLYSAALEKGYSPSSIFQDAPLSLPDGDGGTWSPQNDDGKYDGPVSLRRALAESKNVVAIRLLQSIGVSYARNYTGRFSVDPARQPASLSMALGAGAVTPMQMAAGYATFANGGYQVNPWLIRKIVDADGKVLAEFRPPQAGGGAPRVIDARNAYLMTSMMQDVVRYGTGAAAGKLGRHDLAGKTGTTSDMVDAWFCGYSPKVVTVAWIGFDKPRSLGSREFGAQAALPVWTDYMAQALAGTPDTPYALPAGIVSARIDPGTGAAALDGAGAMDLFYKEALPAAGPATTDAPTAPTAPDGALPAADNQSAPDNSDATAQDDSGGAPVVPLNAQQ